jgi:hypothetical protein
MKAELKAALVSFGAVFVVIQVLPGIGRDNPASHAITTPPPPEVQQVLRRACYDCHSNETEWPAASRVAPMAWAVESHVYGGRAKMNFSLWPDDPHGQAVARKKIGAMVSAGRMPLMSYRLGNERGRLTESELQVLQAWAAAPADAPPIKDVAYRGDKAAVVK